MNPSTNTPPPDTPPTTDASSEKKPHVLQRLRKLINHGRIAELSELEAKALLAYLAHADYRNGTAFPSIDTVAREIGTENRNRARKAVAGLEKRGILRTVQAGGGRANATIREIIDIETGTVSVPDSAKENGDGQRPETGTVNDLNGDAQRTETGTASVPRTILNTFNPSSTPQTGDDGGNVGGEEEDIILELKAAGIRGRKLESLSKLEGLTPLDIRMLRLTVPSSYDNPAVYVITELEAGAYGKAPGPRQTLELVKAGQITEVCGYRVAPGLVRANDNFMCVYGENVSSVPAGSLPNPVATIFAKDLTPERLTLSPIRQAS